MDTTAVNLKSQLNYDPASKVRSHSFIWIILPTDINSLEVPDCKLWRVLARMRMPFRDTCWICPGGLKRKPGDISKLCERIHVCLGLEDPRDLSTSSQ